MIGLSTSCQKELAGGQETIGGKPFTITASIADGGTKVSYAEDETSHALKPSWVVGDVIIGFDGDGNTYGYSVTEVNDETKKATLAIITEGDNAGNKTENPANDTKMYMFYAPGKTPSAINTTDKSLTVSLASQDKDVVPALMMASATVTNSSLSLEFENKTAIIGIKSPTMAMANKAYTSLALSGSAGLNTEVKFDLSGDALQASYQTAGTITKTLDFTSDASTKVGPDVIYIVACPLATAANLTFTFNGNEEYFKVAGATMEAGHYYYMMPTTGKQKFAITVQDGITGGTISTSPSGNVAWDETVTVTATPDTGYELATLTYNDGSDQNITVTGNTGTFTMPKANVTVSGSFQLKDFAITQNAAIGGTYTVKKGDPKVDATTGKMNEEIFVSVSPATGYSGGTVTVKKTGTEETVPFSAGKFTMPASNVTISVEFTHDSYTLTGTPSPTEGGTVTFKKGTEDATSAHYGDVITIVNTASDDYVFSSVSAVDASSNPVTITDNTFTMPASNVTVTTTFAKKSFSITSTPVTITGGSFKVKKGDDVVTSAQWGETIMVEVTKPQYYAVEKIKVYKTGTEETVEFDDTNNTFTMPKYNVTIEVTFTPDGSAPPTEMPETIGL